MGCCWYLTAWLTLSAESRLSTLVIGHCLTVGVSDWSVEVSGGEEPAQPANHRRYDDDRPSKRGGANSRRRNDADDNTVLDQDTASITSVENGILPHLYCLPVTAI